jgi:hypothetical protein
MKAKGICRATVFLIALLPAMQASAQYGRWRAGQCSFDTNMWYKTKTIIAYKVSDSTMADKKLDYKETSTYAKTGDQLGTVKVNANGKKLEETKYTYDERDNMTGYETYDSLGKLSSSTLYVYDSQGRMSSYTSKSPMFYYTYNQADSDKMLTYTYHYQYDFAGNIIETSTDSAGVIINNTTSTFDAKGREVSSREYDHKCLQTSETIVFDSKGGYTSTEENYYDASGNSCSPNTNKTVTKYDKDGNELSSLTVTQENGINSTSKTTYKYKFEKGKMVSSVMVLEETGDSHSSKSTTSWIYKYDQAGNLLESSEKGYTGTSLTRYTYNNKNKPLTETSYGSCVDKPVSMSQYVYFPNDTVIKELHYLSYSYPSSSVIKYNERSEFTEEISHNSYDNKYQQTVYTYEYWEK